MTFKLIFFRALYFMR
uniref:Uncharacterized protein n=1 Tax=Anguilla anguilla TaxID=7936 RepID=A0A0E9U9T6_ANGAN